jgi:hypothetical protein
MDSLDSGDSLHSSAAFARHWSMDEKPLLPAVRGDLRVDVWRYRPTITAALKAKKRSAPPIFLSRTKACCFFKGV